MVQYHQLDSSNRVNIKCNNKNIERAKEYKLLGIIILDEHFELHSHVSSILKDCYSTSQTLKLLKRCTYYLRKQLSQPLILSK